MKNIFEHYRKEFVIFLSVLFFLQLTLFNTNNLVFADTNTPTVSYSIQGDTTVGSIVEIAVNISNAKDLYGGSIDFVYDTSLLEVQSISKGSIFGSNKIITPLGDNGKISNGQASFGISLTGSQSGVTKNNEILAIIKAKVLKEGTVKLSTTSSNTSALSLNGFTARVKLSNSKAQSISYDSKNSNIQLLAKAKVTSYEENNPLITYSGYWSDELVSSNSNGNAKYSNATNASFTFSFEGTGFRWYGLSNQYKGVANIYIDGIKQSLDTYISSTAYKTLFFEKANLDNVRHTVKIEVSGNKSPTSEGSFIHVDRIDILNGKLINTTPITSVTSYEENESAITYSGYWANEAVSSNSGGNGKYSNSANASFTFSFEGTGFRWYGFANENKGIANVYIDGVKQTVDTFTGNTSYKTLFFEKPNLDNGKHTVKIEVSGNKNPNAYSNFIHIDKIEILNGTLIGGSPAPTINSYEENNPLIKYSGYWANEAVSSNSGGNGKYSNSANASFTFSFEGTGFRWYGFANENKGIANVYIDGVKQTVDTFTGNTSYKTLFLEKTGLAQGKKHTVKIEVSGNKNPAAYSNFIHVDTIDILNGKLIDDSTPTETFTSYEENNPLIKYSGYWANEAVSSNSGGNGKYSNSANASFTFSFEGTGFRWYGFANENKGIANVYIDGVKQTVDTFTGSTKYKTLFLEKKGLAQGKHTVKIEVSGNKNPAAYSNFIHVDTIDILNGNLVEDSVPTETFTSYEENNPLIKYYGYWANEAVSSNSGGNGKYSNSANASFTFSFEGTGFRWYGFANENKGIANVYIDGVKQTVDTFTGSTKYKTLFLEKKGLAQGKHTVKIEVSGNKNPAAYSNFIHVDTIDILNGNLVEDSVPTETFTSYEENNPLIKYSGYWANEAVSSNSGGNGKYSNSANASFTFSFEGTGFRWYGFANENKGIANVYIDGVKQTVDTFTGSTKYKTLFLEKKGLAQGKHTVKIEVSGNKNPAAYSNFIHVDTIDILNGNLVEDSVPTETFTSYEENNPLIKYSGYWADEAVSSNSGGNGKYSNSANASFTFSFEGTGFRWYGFANENKGIANVYIDGVKQTVDTFTGSTKYKTLFLEKKGLAQGKHTVKIEVSGNKNPAAYSNFIHIDTIDILNGNLVEDSVPTETFTSYEENNPLIKYSGYWADEAVSSNSGGNGKYSNSANASFTFSFEGTGFRWYGFANENKGIANVYIDGVKQTVDTFTGSTKYKTLFLEKKGLAQGKHTVKIEVSGNKNPAAYSNFIHVDTIDILNGNLVQ